MSPALMCLYGNLAYCSYSSNGSAGDPAQVYSYRVDWSRWESISDLSIFKGDPPLQGRESHPLDYATLPGRTRYPVTLVHLIRRGLGGRSSLVHLLTT